MRKTIKEELEFEKGRLIGFDQGAVLAVCLILHLHDETTIAKDVLKEINPDFEHIDEYDLNILRKYKEELGITLEAKNGTDKD